ncbi:MAG: hypothetical protein WDZ59_10560 [Pirellulales bacterium]
MFPLHERSRKRICRAGFLALCILPTLGVVAWCAWHALPGRHLAVARELSAITQFEVSLEEASHPLPGTTHYHNIGLFDPETGRPLARTAMVKQTHGEQSEIVSAAALALDPRGLPMLVERVVESLREAEGSTMRVRLDRLTLEPLDVPPARSAASDGHAARRNVATLFDIQCGTDYFPDGAHGWVRFALDAETAAQRVQVRVLRDRSGTSPATVVELDTGGAELPCSLAAPLWPALGNLGTQCRFQGKLTLWPSPQGTSGRFEGTLSGVDLGQLVGHTLGQRLTGLAQVRIHSATLYRGRLEELDAEIAAGPGEIPLQMLAAGLQWLDLAAQGMAAEGASTVAYQQLAARVLLDGTGLALTGACNGASPGAVLVSDLLSLRRKTEAKLPVAALTAVVNVRGDSTLPLSREAASLARLLPLPSTKPAR